jgi:SsrA-binding protein
MNARIVNRKARHLYEILETWEAGIVLSGNEVKAVKSGHADLKGAYVRVRVVNTKDNSTELHADLINAFIPPYNKAGTIEGYEPRRTRQLLLHKREINNLLGKLTNKGLTVVPLSLYTRKRLVKVQIGLARGKTKVDKREDIKKRDIDRDVRRVVFRQ